MIQPWFVPAALRQSQSDYLHPSPREISRLAQALRKPAVGFSQEAEAGQRRALEAWHSVAREWEQWNFTGSEHVLSRLESTTRMSQPVLRESVANHFRVITRGAMEAWLDEIREIRSGATLGEYPSLTAIFSAGNIPGVAIQPIIQLSLLGIPAFIKTATTEPDFMPALIQTLERHDPETASRIITLSWPRTEVEATQALMAHTPLVIAFGDDHTIDQIGASTKAEFAGFGDKFSLAVIHAHDVKVQTLRRLIYDHVMFDGKGCLSPQAILVIADNWDSVRNLALHLSGLLTEKAIKWPAGNWSAEEKAMMQQWRGEWRTRQAAGENLTMFCPDDLSWTVVAGDEFDLDQRVAFRTVRLWWIRDFEEVLHRLRHYSARIQALAIDLDDHETAQLTLDLDEHEEVLGRVICAPGELQRPVFGWMGTNRKWFELMCGVEIPD